MSPLHPAQCRSGTQKRKKSGSAHRLVVTVVESNKFDFVGIHKGGRGWWDHGIRFPKDHERVTGHRKCKSGDPLVTTVTTAVAALLVATLLLVATAVATVAAAVTATATAEAAEATTATAAGATLSSLVNTDATTVEPGRELLVKVLSRRWIGRSIKRSIERSSQTALSSATGQNWELEGKQHNRRQRTAAKQPGSEKGKKGNRSLLLVVHGVHSVGSVIIGSVAHETETTAAAGIAVLDDGLENKKSDQTPSGGQRGRKSPLTASSTTPNSSKRWRRDWSSVPQERPLETENGQ